ncbi:hypothetical protein [Tetrasphaera phage TJE1]|uniref:Uncharacterized protein n=1 Tax=Tetrasphaera phage TJE1 TaxID=981335 RepID=G4W990_9CAUD|nr:hypothetical protein G185_gp58 [Tetrasphaera phage TJE1]ADX42578.1 hypothetical protein [Tetrasphaera phage TJE1]
MSNDNSGPAFPSEGGPYVRDGMTKRELIAMNALQGILANSAMIDQSSPGSFNWASVAATKFADALLAELAKE